MSARHAPPLTLLRSSRPPQLSSRPQLALLTPLAATLMDFPASVANKRLTAGLSPLAATLTKNPGGALEGSDSLSLFTVSVATRPRGVFSSSHQSPVTGLPRAGARGHLLLESWQQPHKELLMSE